MLHACCGPCSLEPSRILNEQGYSFDIFYANCNIAPQEEYIRRLETLKSWANDSGIDVIEGPHNHADWVCVCKEPFENGEISREERCRRCYKLRFEDTVRYAKENGYTSISTTLSVSPYQYTDLIAQELNEACKEANLDCVFEDFRPYYDEATRRSREARMYRQNYCGCEISMVEADAQRVQRRQARKAEKERKRQENAELRAAEEARIDARKKERKEYDEKRARRHAILKKLRSENSQDRPSV